MVASEIPADLRDEAELYREQLLDELFNYSQRAGGADAGRVRRRRSSWSAR